MEQTFKATEVEIGYHPSGYRIDKTASAMNRYTKWNIVSGRNWSDPQAVCFDALPPDGWFKQDQFDWDNIDITEGAQS